MSAISWKNPVSGNWVDASDWSGGKVPRAADAVSIGGIGATTAYGVNIIGSGNFAAESITIDDSYVTVVVWDLISVPVITLDAGNLNLINTDMGETKLVANGGALITTGGDLASISIAGTLDLIGTTTDTGAGSLSVGSLALGAGTLDNINDASVSAGTISSDGGTLWGGNNPTNCSLDGNITLVSTGGEVDDSTLAGENGSGAGTLNLVSASSVEEAASIV